MPGRDVPPPPPPPLPTHRRLHKLNSWSPDLLRDEAWQRRKGKGRKEGCSGGGSGLGRSRSISDEDLEELRGCMDLGFGFDSPEIDPKLSDTFPALGFYHAVNKQYQRSLSRSSSVSSLVSVASDNDSDQCSSSSIYDPGE